MINLLYHIDRIKRAGKRVDVLDDMWQEMRLVVLNNRVPIYGQYLQKLINTKLDQETQLTYYEFVKPPILSLAEIESDPEDVGAPTSNKRARHTSVEGGPSSSQAEPTAAAPKKKHILKSIFQKMNCFFIDH